MLWFTIWFMVILKIPILYLAYVIWWSVKDAPEPATGEGSGGIFDPRRPDRGPRLGLRGGPHGTHRRRLARRAARVRA
jgi:hypothetical protein